MWGLQASAADRRLLQEGRLAGPMPWVIAIMMFLTALAAAAGLALGSAASGLSADLAGRLTVQLPEPSAEIREAQTKRVVAELKKLAAVNAIEPLPEEKIVAMLEPWLGTDGLDADLPLPALIDVTLRRNSPDDILLIRETVKAAAPGARVDQHAQWLAPLSGLLQSLKWLSVALVILMTVATAAAVVLAARAALNTHRSTIDVMHLLGASDDQIAKLFQRRIALDALFGGLVGLILALVVMLLIGQRMAALGSDLLGSATLGWGGWLTVLTLPLAGAALSTFSARLTVLRALRRIL
jgi:cell division transport system permease protein